MFELPKWLKDAECISCRNKKPGFTFSDLMYVPDPYDEGDWRVKCKSCGYEIVMMSKDDYNKRIRQERQMGDVYKGSQTDVYSVASQPKPTLKTIEVDLPTGGGGGPSCDNAYDEAYDRAIRNAIPLGCRYVRHTTRTIYRYVADVTYEEPPPKQAR